jgi:hypothetical protein
MATSVFGGKRNNDYWKRIFEEGQTPDGQKVLGQRLDLIKMIQPQYAPNPPRDQEAQSHSPTTHKQSR